MVLEKTHTAKISLTAPTACYTRLANRFLKECEEVLERIPQEVRCAADAIRLRTQVDDCEDEEKVDSRYYSDGVYYSARLEWEFYSCVEDGMYIFYYYFLRSQVYNTTYCGVKHTSGDFQEIEKMKCRQKGPIRYFCMHRPPSPGAIPGGYVTYETFSNHGPYPGSIGEVTYLSPPPAKELDRWGLILDPEWLPLWSYLGFGIYDYSMPKDADEQECKKLLETHAARQRIGRRSSCPRCGMPRMDKGAGGEPVESKFAKIMICSICGIHEDRLANIQSQIPFSQWAYSRYALLNSVEWADYALKNGCLD